MKKFYLLAAAGMLMVAGFASCGSKSSDETSSEEMVAESEEVSLEDADSSDDSDAGGFVDVPDNPSDIKVKLSSQLRDHVTVKSIQLAGKPDASWYDPGINLVLELKEPIDFDGVWDPRPGLRAIAMDASEKLIPEFGPDKWENWNVGVNDFLAFFQGEPGEIISVTMRPLQTFKTEEEMNENLAKIKEFVINLKN